MMVGGRDNIVLPAYRHPEDNFMFSGYLTRIRSCTKFTCFSGPFIFILCASSVAADCIPIRGVRIKDDITRVVVDSGVVTAVQNYNDWSPGKIYSTAFEFFTTDGSAIDFTGQPGYSFTINIQNSAIFWEDLIMPFPFASADLVTESSGTTMYKLSVYNADTLCYATPEIPVNIPCCWGNVGNLDNSAQDEPDIADLTALIDCLFILPGFCFEFVCDQEWNIDGDAGGGFDIGDVTILVDHMFISFQPLASCPE